MIHPQQSSLNSMDDLRHTWAFAPDGEEPEEMESPQPVQLEYAHAFLGKPRVEAIREYKDLWAVLYDVSSSSLFFSFVEYLLLLRGWCAGLRPSTICAKRSKAYNENTLRQDQATEWRVISGQYPCYLAITSYN
jgi:hypothetical protein